MPQFVSVVLQPLDLRTLFVVSAVVIAFSGCVLIVARGRDRNAVALLFWGAAMLSGAVGIALLAVERTAGPALGAAGTAAILAGTALSWTGARVFAGRRPVLSLLIGGPGAWLLLRSLDWEGTGLVPEVLSMVMGGGYTLGTAVELWRDRAETLQTRSAAAVLLLLHAGVYLGRAVHVAAMPGQRVSDAASTVLMFEALLHTMGMAFLLLALMKERAELRATTHLRDLAMHDGLTGLSNRRQFDGVVDMEFRRAQRRRTSLGLLMIDVDQFKAFNDTYGHQPGDDALCAVARVVGAAARRPGDLATRYGGEEFTVLLPHTDEAGAAAVAQTIHEGLARLQIGHTASVHAVLTASIGVAAVVPGESNHWDKLVRAADRALYEAKASGRNATFLASQLRDPATEAAREGAPRLGGLER